MKIRFGLDNKLQFKKRIIKGWCSLIIGSGIYDNNKYHPQVFLDEVCLN